MSSRNARALQSNPAFLAAYSSRRSLLQRGAAFGVGLAGLGAIAPTAHAATGNQLRAANIRRKASSPPSRWSACLRASRSASIPA